MTREDTIKVLAILKAAYPASYRNMSRDEANGTVMIWATQFANGFHRAKKCGFIE